MASLAHVNQLQISDLAEVLQLLRRYGYSATSYYSLGLYLGLSSATLDVIRINNKGDTESCLRECLTKWLQKADNVQKKDGPTIYSLISALRELKQNIVADGIDMEKHPACRILARYSSDESLLTALPLLSALISSEVIKEMMLQRDIPMDEVKQKICKDYRKLEVFAEILCKSTVTAEIGRIFIREYREAYGSDSIIVDDKNGLNIYLPMNVTSMFMMMRLKFGQTFLKVESVLMNSPQSLNFDDIKRVLGVYMYNSTLKPQLAQCKDIRDILQLVRDNSSLDDISDLEVLVNEFNIEEAKPVIEEYKGVIEELEGTKVSQCLNESFSISSPLECERITIVVDEHPHESALKDVKRLSLAVFKNSSQHIRLNVIRDGKSFIITCSFPLILSEQLIRAALNNIDVLKENNVKILTIGYYTVYKESNLYVHDTFAPTKSYEQQLLSTSSGLLKQLKLLFNLQLNENKAESLKKAMDDNNRLKMALTMEIDFLREKISKTMQLLDEKGSQLAKSKEENLKLRVLLQSEKEDNERTHNLLVQSQKKLKEDEQTSLEKEVALIREKEELQRKFDDLQQELELQQVKDHKEVSIQCEYTITESDIPTTHKQVEELEKKLKEEEQTSSSFMKQKQVALREKEELQIKINDLQQKLELQQVKDHEEVSVQCEYTINQSEQAPVEQKEEAEILQETETVHTCTYISKDDISKLSVILEPFEDDWYHIGQCLQVKESVLTEIKEMTPVDSRLTHVLETWCHEKDRTITELKESLKRMDRDDILEGLHELPTGQYTMNNDDEGDDINVKDSNDEVESQIETENKEIQTTQTTLDKEIQFNYLVPSQDNLEGLSESQIAGKKLFLVQGDKPQLMNWEEYGLRISVPEDSLSASETVEVSVLALVGGHFKFPDNTRLVSAVYAISTSPLLKSLRIEMQHCIDLSDPSLSKYLKFAVAPVHTASLPYQFSIIEGGEFPAYQRYGSIERSKFCQLAIVGEEEDENGGGRNEESNGEEDGDSGDEGKGQREGQGAGGQEGEAGGVGRSDGQEEGNGLKEPVDCTEDSELSTSQSKTIVSTHSTGIPEATLYAGQVFYQREERRDLMTFTAARDLNPLRQYIKKEYCHPQIDQSIYFKLASSPKGSCVELIFNVEQPEEITGWRIKPHLVPCQIKEYEILGFGDISTTIPPSCLVSIYAENSPHTVPNLSYSVPLKGVQEQVELIINRPLRNMSSLPSVPSLPVSTVPVVVTDDTNLGLCARNALKKQQEKLRSLLSRSEPIFRDIAIACTSATIIHSTEYDKIFDVKTGQSLAERADTFINCIMSVVDVCPDQLEVFLNIVMNKGNIAFVRIAELISQCFNGEVPEQCCIKLNKQ